MFHVSRFMSLIDFILNLVALLLWFNWRTARFDPLAGSTPATLAGTLRRTSATPFQTWFLPLSIPALLLLRALFYWQIGGALGWTGRVDLGVVAVPFWCDSSRTGTACVPAATSTELTSTNGTMPMVFRPEHLTNVRIFDPALA